MLLWMRGQAKRTLDSPRRLLVILVLLALFIAAALLALFVRSPSVVQYQDRFPTATPGEVCPGESFTYPVMISIENANSIARVTEGWCRASDGICPRTLQQPPVYYNFVEPYTVRTTGTRTAPEELAPGQWQLRHCNEAHSTGRISVVCYQVDVMVKDCRD